MAEGEGSGSSQQQKWLQTALLVGLAVVGTVLVVDLFKDNSSQQSDVVYMRDANGHLVAVPSSSLRQAAGVSGMDNAGMVSLGGAATAQQPQQPVTAGQLDQAAQPQQAGGVVQQPQAPAAQEQSRTLPPGVGSVPGPNPVSAAESPRNYLDSDVENLKIITTALRDAILEPDPIVKVKATLNEQQIVFAFGENLANQIKEYGAGSEAGSGSGST
mmetsp:Transcript_15168/g.48383  ORF Transcript_15168/g.48383 Transcript_15168/m.48383 type:complete len:215 (-) Transcript_15168:110-754(-)|eukprot:CAMPEP_0196769172 /NCGR_PEP_ID=MMETSP1104-20130614/378_1 /TAXON_ID=33652 /ORGANISM="Cafeteria sp., Strain Caron Lab Isolate" /LENGTH=214 /DNA_ID=CAMNT_0042139257 /DNA_START=19 /DNA_END=663 /DNA_ORIENTATION=+